MPDIMGLMKQASELQSKMSELQAELDRTEVDGAAGGGLVRLTMSAKGEVRSVNIDPSLLTPQEKQVVEDLMVAAHGDARRKAEILVQEKMQSLTGGLPIPPGMKLF